MPIAARLRTQLGERDVGGGIVLKSTIKRGRDVMRRTLRSPLIQQSTPYHSIRAPLFCNGRARVAKLHKYFNL